MMCFDYAGLLLAVAASLSTSLLFSIEDDHVTLAEAGRAFLQSIIAGIAYAQNPFRPHRPESVAFTDTRDEERR
jgi:hypothetical protein